MAANRYTVARQAGGVGVSQGSRLTRSRPTRARVAECSGIDSYCWLVSIARCKCSGTDLTASGDRGTNELAAPRCLVRRRCLAGLTRIRLDARPAHSGILGETAAQRKFSTMERSPSEFVSSVIRIQSSRGPSANPAYLPSSRRPVFWMEVRIPPGSSNISMPFWPFK
jgi:hypothetical protein